MLRFAYALSTSNFAVVAVADVIVDGVVAVAVRACMCLLAYDGKIKLQFS